MLQTLANHFKRFLVASLIAATLLVGSATGASVLNSDHFASPVVVADGGGSGNPPCSC